MSTFLRILSPIIVLPTFGIPRQPTYLRKIRGSVVVSKESLLREQPFLLISEVCLLNVNILSSVTSRYLSEHLC